MFHLLGQIFYSSIWGYSWFNVVANLITFKFTWILLASTFF